MRPGLICGGDDFLRKIKHQRDALPVFLFGDAEKKAAEQGSEFVEIPWRPLLREVRVLHLIINREPLKKPFLHFGSPETQTVANIIKKQELPLREETPGEKSLQRNVVDFAVILNGEQVEDVSVK